ncbi:MAG: Fic family protein [Candidatus Aquilonibacter sp.]
MSVTIIKPAPGRLDLLETVLDAVAVQPELERLLLLRILSSEYAHRVGSGEPPRQAASETATYLDALERMSDVRLEGLSLEGIRTLHAISRGRTEPTQFRRTSVAMRANLPGARLRLTGSTPDSVAPRLEELLSSIVRNHRLGRFEKIAFTYFELIRTHPFKDGNGRLCRLLLTTFLKNEFTSRMRIGITHLIRTNFRRYNTILRNQDANVYAQWLSYLGGMVTAELHASDRFVAIFQSLDSSDRREILKLAEEAFERVRLGDISAFSLAPDRTLSQRITSLYSSIVS